MSNKKFPPEIQHHFDELLQENKLMRQLATSKGFYDYFFSQLPNFDTYTDCFNMVNEKYFDFFGEYKYSTYNSFSVTNRKQFQNK